MLQARSKEAGFTLVELMISMTVTLVVLAMAMTTFSNALTLNDTATLLGDATQNLRAGGNLLVRDLMQTGRGIPTGGIPIPSGPDATAINRPSPPDSVYYFDNTEATTLPAITTGNTLGPSVGGDPTDMITLLASDPTSYIRYDEDDEDAPLAPLELNWGADPAQWPDGLTAPTPSLAADGSSLNVRQYDRWISDPASGIRAGDLLLFTNALGSAIQTVTRVEGTRVFFDNDERDQFNFNQRGVSQGSIMQIRSDDGFPQTTVVRVHMLTYFIDADTTPGTPRLMRQVNFFQPQALAGVLEDLEITYDLVDGVNNPTEIPELPYTVNQATYTSNQIRKVNLHIGVRSDTRAGRRGDYMRHHVSTSVSIRSLAYVSRYE